jgi:hypothetical protein
VAENHLRGGHNICVEEKGTRLPWDGIRLHCRWEEKVSMIDNKVTDGFPEISDGTVLSPVADHIFTVAKKQV